jgi:hypothetical protein
MNRHHRRRHWIALIAAGCGAWVCLTASVLLAKQGVVKTRDGRTLEGDVTEKQDGVVISLRGIPTNIARENIESIQYVGNIEQQYKEKLDALPKTPTAKDHLDIARWLFDNKAYELARKEVDAALLIDPNSAEATTLYTTIQSQMRLEHTRPAPGGNTAGTISRPNTPNPAGTGTGTAAGTGTGAGATTGTAAAHTASLHKYLSGGGDLHQGDAPGSVQLDQINLLKQAEWPADDNSVKVSFFGDVKHRYVLSAQENAAAFNALSPNQQARRILADGTPSEKAAIRIVNDPQPLTDFKRAIQPGLLTGCATAACHGGPKGGKFFLYPTPDSDAATYTNFYLLNQVTANVGGAERRMIDRTYPDQSLIFLFGLPPEISKVSHPEVKGVAWRSIFASTQDPKYKAVYNWVNKLVKPDPTYGFTFKLDESDITGDSPKPAAPPPPAAPPAAPPPATRPAQQKKP